MKHHLNLMRRYTHSSKKLPQSQSYGTPAQSHVEIYYFLKEVIIPQSQSCGGLAQYHVEIYFFLESYLSLNHVKH